MVTKFQRVVPVMNVRSKDKKKVVRYDPSRHSHQIKRLDNGKNELVSHVCLLLDAYGLEHFSIVLLAVHTQ